MSDKETTEFVAQIHLLRRIIDTEFDNPYLTPSLLRYRESPSKIGSRFDGNYSRNYRGFVG